MRPRAVLPQTDFAVAGPLMRMLSAAELNLRQSEVPEESAPEVSSVAPLPRGRDWQAQCCRSRQGRAAAMAVRLPLLKEPQFGQQVLALAASRQPCPCLCPWRAARRLPLLPACSPP